ncbi:hypothetical protein, partial [Xanthomonas fragariae]|uniref:hypothetical protein n=1 Tax=Xanthomonas fragariae TaxID=48664 RepID=UPI003530B34B
MTPSRKANTQGVTWEKRPIVLERLTKPFDYCFVGGKIAGMTRRKESPIALWKRIEPLIPQV